MSKALKPVITSRARADGTLRFKAKFYAGFKAGVALYVYGVGDTEREADEDGRKKLLEQNPLVFADHKALTIAEWLTQFYDQYNINIKESTLHRYLNIIRVHINPEIGSIPLQKLKAEHVVALLTTMRKSGQSASSRNQARNILNTAMTMAKKLKKVPVNVVADTDPSTRPQAEKRVLTPEETALVVDELTESWYRDHFITMAYTGMRRAEVMGLRRRDVDLDRKMIYVRQSVYEYQGKVTVSTLKTKRSRRDIDIPDALCTMLKQRLELFTELGPDDPLFPNRSGTWADPNYITDAVRRLRMRIGRPDLTPHLLRHTHISMLLASGQPLPAVSARAGHSSTHVTASIYAHALPGSGRALADAIGSMLDVTNKLVPGVRSNVGATEVSD